MSTSDEELRALYRGRTRRSTARSGCLEARAIVRVATGEAEADERLEVARHVAACSDCALELQSVRRSLGPREGSGPKRLTLPGRAWWMAVAALVLLALLPLLVSRTGVQDVTRGGSELAVEPRMDATLAAPPSELAWPAQPGATGYRALLLDARGEPLFRSERLVEPRVALPPDAVRALAAGGAFVWRVEVEGGAARSRLGPFWFRIGPER